MNASCQNKFGCCCVRYIAMSIIFPVRNNVKRKCVKSRLASAKRHMNRRNARYQGNSQGMGAPCPLSPPHLHPSISAYQDRWHKAMCDHTSLPSHPLFIQVRAQLHSPRNKFLATPLQGILVHYRQSDCFFVFRNAE